MTVYKRFSIRLEGPLSKQWIWTHSFFCPFWAETSIPIAFKISFVVLIPMGPRGRIPGGCWCSWFYFVQDSRWKCVENSVNPEFPKAENYDILESCISPLCSSMPTTLLMVIIWVPVFQFYPTPGVIIDTKLFCFILLCCSTAIAMTTCSTVLLASPARSYLQF